MNASHRSLSKEILSTVRKSLLELGTATKVELSEKIEISFPTISKFLSQMEKDGEVISVGLDESRGGRRAKRYKYNPEHMLGLAIFLEGNGTHYTIFNCLGEVKEQGTYASVLVEDGIQLLTTFIEKMVAIYSKISSIAIGVPGSVENGRIFYIPGYEHFQDFDIKAYLEEYFSLPVVVENDMNAAVLGFHHNMGNDDHHSLVYLYSGQNGPGAGLMINGDVVRGRTFFAGEISFVPQYDNRNFRQAMENESMLDIGSNSSDDQIDAISRLVASLVAIINPHTVILCKDEIGIEDVDKISINTSKYIPSAHLPELTISDWKQDYLFGLQRLGLELMIYE